MSVISSPALFMGEDGYQISRSVRLRSSASAYFNRTSASSVTSNTTWTYSFWMKIGSQSTSGAILETSSSGTTGVSRGGIRWGGSNDLELFQYNGSTYDYRQITTQVFRDPSAWYHIVVVADTSNGTASNRMKLYVNNVQVTSWSTNTQPSSSLATYVGSASKLQRIGVDTYNGSSEIFDGYITEINFIDGQALTPSSFGENDSITGVWKPKKYAGTYGTNGFYLPFTNTATTGGNGFTYSEDFGNAAWTKYQSTVTTNATTAPNGTTTADKLIETATTGDHQTSRTFSATDNTAYTWSTYAKQGERSNFRMYLQNKAGTYNYADFDLSTGAIGTQSGVTALMTSVGNGWYRCSVSCNAGTGATASPLAILSYSTVSAGSGTNGLYIWGAQLEGSTSVPGAYYTTTSAGFGTYQIGADQSIATGGYNSWVANNISLTAGATYDSMIDTPTPYADGGNGRGNYPVMNPLGLYGSISLVDGNLKGSSSSSNVRAYSNFVIPSTGKWYLEFTEGSSGFQGDFGLLDYTYILANPSSISYSNGATIYSGYYFLRTSATAYTGGGSVSDGTSLGFAVQGVKGLAIDMDAGRVYFIPNSSGFTNSAYLSIDTTKQWVVGGHRTTTFTGVPFDFIVNFGQRPFAYTPPTGFKALNTQNLPDSTIKAGNKYFDATTYTGTGATQTITNSGGFQPDLIWGKQRNGASSNVLTDSVRGVNAQLSSNLTNAEASNTDCVTAFGSTGFTVGASASYNMNQSGSTLVAWQWKKGATPGFDIVTWAGNSTSGRTVAHSLGVAPSMIITKSRTNPSSWVVGIGGMSGFGVNDYLTMNTTNAKASSSTFYQAYGSSTFTVGVSAADEMNKIGNNYVSYLFAEVAGFSKFGSYTGNGSADGPFVYCGFRARYLLIKETGNANSWEVYDTARNSANVQTQRLFPNDSIAEATTNPSLDILSNGFKCRAGNTGINRSGGTYIFAAFAENPLKFSLAR